MTDEEALTHYLSFGTGENRNMFDLGSHLADNPSQVAAGTDVLTLLGEPAETVTT